MLAASLAGAIAVAAPQPKSIRVDFTSKPEGASVFVDGKDCGVTPLTLFDLEQGAHRATFEFPNYEAFDDFFNLGDGAYTVRHATLEPKRGLLLVKTDPSGADISLDGVSYGESPRLITTLNCTDSYRFLLQKKGYQSRYMEVKFSGRTPLVKEEKLILDSGAVSIKTTPEGASVLVNGIRRGVTPLALTDVPKGRATISLSLDGYIPEERTITLDAGDSQEVDVEMQPRPGSLFLISNPDGARFYINGNVRGKGPVTIDEIRPGKYTIRAELEGYGAVEREVVIAPGGSASEEFRLSSVRGSLEVKTSPPGAQIIIDGHLLGSTVAGASDEVSDVFIVRDLSVGEHTMIVRKEGFAEVVSHPVIANSRTSQKMVRMRRVFKPNVEVVTSSGVHKGVFIDNSPEAITIEVSMGITRSFLREDIKDIRFIAPQQ